MSNQNSNIYFGARSAAGHHIERHWEREAPTYTHPAIGVALLYPPDWAGITLSIYNDSLEPVSHVIVEVFAVGERLSDTDHDLNDTIIKGIVAYSPPIAMWREQTIKPKSPTGDSSWSTVRPIPWQISQTCDGHCIVVARLAIAAPGMHPAPEFHKTHLGRLPDLAVLAFDGNILHAE